MSGAKKGAADASSAGLPAGTGPRLGDDTGGGDRTHNVPYEPLTYQRSTAFGGLPLVRDDLPAAECAALLQEVQHAHAMGVVSLTWCLTEAVDMSRAKGPSDGGRAAAIVALSGVIAYLEGFELFRTGPSLAPLINLLGALVELDRTGARHPMLEPGRGSNMLPGDRARLHAMAAAWSVTLARWGMAPAAADAHVATALAKSGYRLRGRDAEKPTAVTIAEWRKQALTKDKPAGVHAATFHSVLASVPKAAPSADFPEQFSAMMLRILRGLVPHLLPVWEKTPSSSPR